MCTRLLALSLLLAVPQVVAAQAVAAEEGGEQGRSWHRLVGILQYLQADYPAAVESQSEFELAEQRSFMAEAVEAAQELGPEGQAFLPRLQSLRARVELGEAPEEVSRGCGELVEELVKVAGLARSPRRVPDVALGAQVYQQACAACHGEDGRAEVPIAATMEPQPTNFQDPGVMEGLTPYKAFNTTSFGVPGTPMPGFPTLTEEERWSVAFFLFTLRQPACEGEAPRVALETLANSTDPELMKAWGERHLPCLRRELPEMDQERALMAARTSVEQALQRGAGGDMGGARNLLLDAYLNGVEPVEATLRARNPDLVVRLEQGFLEARLAAERKSPHFKEKSRELLGLLDEARRGSSGTASLLSVLWLTVLILLREGFEASIIVAALLAMLRKMEAPGYARVVHAGWVSALAVGAVAFVFGQHLLGGANRELLEGVAALAAVGMLLYAALWLNARANMSRFMGELRQKMQGALGRGSVAGLFAIAFTAVLRESVETAIFLQGLALDSAAGVAWGALVGAVALGALVVMVNRVGYVLPMKTLFKASTVVLVATAVVLLGKGLHALQEVALVPLAPLPFVTVEVLGVYPDAVSLLPQVALALAPLLWMAMRRGGRAQRLASASSEG